MRVCTISIVQHGVERLSASENFAIETDQLSRANKSATSSNIRMKFLLLIALSFSLVAEAKNLPSKNDVEKVISYMTPVKSQKSRGTCTIFSTLGLFESLLVKKGLATNEIDLSEEWLEYLAMTRQTDEGSTVNRNIKKMRFFGMIKESTWPYLGVKWPDLDAHPLARPRCGHLEGDQQLACLWGHRDPTLLRGSDEYVLERDEEFFHMREEARQFMEDYDLRNFIVKQKSYNITHEEAKKLLSKGTPVIAGLKLYYGSWNHSKTTKFEIQKREKKIWYNGIVGYPEPGSKDRRICDERGGGHSIILVGYDDNKKVTSKLLMDDGTWKTTTYKGVYYFKNSWGVRGFGRDFKLNGRKLPGYGMITQKYLNELGRFSHLPLR